MNDRTLEFIAVLALALSLLNTVIMFMHLWVFEGLWERVIRLESRKKK
jgi:hypothetical protein